MGSNAISEHTSKLIEISAYFFCIVDLWLALRCILRHLHGLRVWREKGTFTDMVVKRSSSVTSGCYCLYRSSI